MENFSTEIISLITETFDEDIELVKDMLFYLYYKTNDMAMSYQIGNWFDKNNYCKTCGNKMICYEWEEKHDELFESPNELFCVYECPYCK